jgi:hypothetical protein
VAILEKNPAKTVDLAKCLGNVADFFHAQGKETTAVDYYRRALTLMRQALGEEHPEVAILMSGLAGVRRSQMHYRESVDLYRRSIPILEASFGARDPQVKQSQAAYQSLMSEANRFLLFAR